MSQEVTSFKQLVRHHVPSNSLMYMPKPYIGLLFGFHLSFLFLGLFICPLSLCSIFSFGVFLLFASIISGIFFPSSSIFLSSYCYYSVEFGFPISVVVFCIVFLLWELYLLLLILNVLRLWL